MAGESDGESSYHRAIVNGNSWNDPESEDGYENVALDSEDEENPPIPSLPAMIRPPEEIEQDGNHRGIMRRRGEQRSEQLRRHVVIVTPQLELEQPEEEPDKKSPIGMYFKVLNYMGCIPYRIGKGFQEETFCGKWLYRVLHFIVAIYTFAQLREGILFGIHLTGAGVNVIAVYIKFALLLLEGIFRCAVIYTFQKKFKWFKTILRETIKSEFAEELNKTSNFVVVGLLLVLNITIVISESLFVEGWPTTKKEFSFARVCKLYYKTFTLSIIAPDYKAFVNNKDDSPDDPSLQVGFGAVILLAKIICGFIEQAGIGLLFLTSMTMYQITDQFHYLIPDGVPEDDNRNHDDITLQHGQMKKICKFMNMPINIIYPLFLARSALTVALFYNISLNPKVKMEDKISIMLQIASMGAIFYFAERASNRIEQFKEWLYDDSEMLMDREEADRLIAQLTAFPIGFGRGITYIDKGFIFSFIILTAAYFLSIVETRPQ